MQESGVLNDFVQRFYVDVFMQDAWRTKNTEESLSVLPAILGLVHGLAGHLYVDGSVDSCHAPTGLAAEKSKTNKGQSDSLPSNQCGRVFCRPFSCEPYPWIVDDIDASSVWWLHFRFRSLFGKHPNGGHFGDQFFSLG